MQFDFDSHRYRDPETGRYVKYADILARVDAEVNRTEVRLKAQARLLVQGKIEIGEFQERMAQTLKEAHLRMAALGSGGTKRMAPIWGKVGAELKRQYKYLADFGADLAAGKLSAKQAIARAGSYAKSVRTSFFNAEFTSRQNAGFYAKRLLDAQAKHCESCISYQRLTWTLLQHIVPPGVDCQCGGACRCRLVYRKV